MNAHPTPYSRAIVILLSLIVAFMAGVVLQELQTDTLRQLNDDALGFCLLMPGDEATLSQRTRDLGRWCAGFLYGLALGGIREGVTLPGNTGEVIKDF